MLDDQKIDPDAAPEANAAPLSPERFAIDPIATSSLAETWTALFSRLTGRARTPAPVERVAPAAAEAAGPTGLRAEAHAAFRSIEGGGPDAALDAALGVMERRIAELQRAVCSYGEALKSIQIYSADAASRESARSALRSAPERLAAAKAIPHLVPGGRHHV